MQKKMKSSQEKMQKKQRERLLAEETDGVNKMSSGFEAGPAAPRHASLELGAGRLVSATHLPEGKLAFT